MDTFLALLEQLKTAASLLSMPVCLLLFVVGLVKGWWVLAKAYKDKERELEKSEARVERLEGKIDDWKSIALTSLSTGDRLADHALSGKGRR